MTDLIMTKQPPRYQRWLDRLGMSASTICAVHCLALPFLLSVLPAIGLGFLGGHTFELIMIATSITIAAVSLGRSYTVHGKLNPLMMMISGAVLLVFNFVGHESHTPLVETLHPYIAGFAGLMIASAHWINLRLCKHCEVCVHDHDHQHPNATQGPEANGSNEKARAEYEEVGA